MFDCVIPTREARHGRLIFGVFEIKFIGPRFYKTININGARWANECRSINEFSNQPELRQYSLAYLHHLFKTQEPLGLRLATLNNIEFYLQLLARIRREIQTGKL
jgi:queuine tRNA-ribosyltransferase